MKRVAEVLGVSRSNLAERARGRAKPRGPYRRRRTTFFFRAFAVSSTNGRPMAIGASRRC